LHWRGDAAWGIIVAERSEKMASIVVPAIAGRVISLVIQVIKRLAALTGFEPPDRFYLYVTVALSVAAYIAAAAGVVFPFDLEGWLNLAAPWLESALELLALPIVAVLFRYADKRLFVPIGRWLLDIVEFSAS